MTTSQRSAHTMLERDGGAEAIIPSLQHRLVELERHRPAALPLRPTSDDLEATYRALLELLDTPPGIKIQSDSFQGASQHVLDRLEVRVVLTSCEEGAGPPADVGQAGAVHGIAGSWMECPGRGPRGRCVAKLRGELVARLQDLPQRRGGRVRRASGSSGRSRGQRPLPVSGRTVHHRRPPPRRGHRSRHRHRCSARAWPRWRTG
jgi:hypothetical protein